MAVAVVVGNGRSHARLLASVFVEGRARRDRDIGKRSVVIVAVENAGRAVAGDINIGPAVFVEIEGGHAVGVIIEDEDAGAGGSYIEERRTALRVRGKIPRPRQPARAEDYG